MTEPTDSPANLLALQLAALALVEAALDGRHEPALIPDDPAEVSALAHDGTDPKAAIADLRARLVAHATPDTKEY